MLIREAKKDECCLVKQQRLASYKNELLEQQWTLLKNNLNSDIDQQLGIKVFVAEIGLEVVGSIVLFPAESKAYDWNVETTYPEICLLAVIPKFRSRGVGTALVEHCLDVCTISKQQFVGLCIGSFMKNAISLYEKMGFERVCSQDVPLIYEGITVEAFRFNL